MKPALLLALCLATVLRAEEPLPGNPAEHGVPGTNAGPATAGNGARPDPAPVRPVAPAAPKLQITPAPAATPALQQVNATLPKFDPEAPQEEGRALTTPSPGTLELPKLTVRPKERPRLRPDVVVTNKGLKDKVSPLDGKLLNKFTLPGWMNGQTAAERAREEQQRKQKDELTQDVNTIARAVETVDPAQARALRDAVSKP
ncbi:MAG: hypothetical protein HYV75_10345 [Opitutae bacterium]|nr:hypothetical protein [Opitutae bacterium]